MPYSDSYAAHMFILWGWTINTTDKQAILEISGFDKSFPGVHAVRNVSMTLYERELLGLCGENGAGKSTLLKMISGVYHTDAGEMFYLGKKVSYRSPQESIMAGISIIYQELSGLANLTVGENIYLGRLPVKRGIIDWKRLNKDVDALMQRYGLNIPANKMMSKLSMAEKQLVEIMKSISTHAQVIIMDEPTSSLGIDNVEKLFRIIRQIHEEEDISIIFISHRLEEIEELCDRILVLRDGGMVAEFTRGNYTVNQLVAQMVGREIQQFYTKAQIDKGEIVFEMESVTSAALRDISINVRAGEIVGLYGMAGSGQSDILKTIFGLETQWTGTMKLLGKDIHPMNPREAIEDRIAYISDDRRGNGLSMPHGINDNIAMASMRQFMKYGLVVWRRLNATAEKWRESLPIKSPSIRTKVNNLSGGNQQKVILAKWIETDPKLLLLNEPTRGIDVKTKHDLFEILQELCKKGMALLMISSDMLEMLSMADRIYTVFDGRITASFTQKNATQEKLMKASINILEEEEDAVS